MINFNFFRRNKKLSEGESQGLNVSGTNNGFGGGAGRHFDEAPTANTEADGELTEDQLEGVKAGVGTTASEARIAQEENREYVESLPKDNDELTEEQLDQVANDMTPEQFNEAMRR